MTALQNLERVRTILGELHEIQKRPFKYAMADLAEWMDKRFEDLGYLLDDTITELHPDYPDQQMLLHQEHIDSIQKGDAA